VRLFRLDYRAPVGDAWWCVGWASDHADAARKRNLIRDAVGRGIVIRTTPVDVPTEPEALAAWLNVHATMIDGK
jgi:hypothetical protein